MPSARRPRGVLAIVGATATGKSSAAVEVAQRLHGEVISADAFAVYRGLDAATAKPSAEERSLVRHHLVDVMDPRDPYSAGAFARQARAIARRLLSEGKLPILCGGTGFYVRAFFEGLFEGPGRDDAFRHALGASEASRPGTLKRMIDLLDPESGQRILAGDAARAIRYLEIAYASGRRPSDLFRERPGERWELPAVKVLLTLPRPVLYERIRERFYGNMAGRLPSEVERLLGEGLSATAPGMSAIGYRETIDFLGGLIDRSEWEERVLGATRRFAKRQETWFRRDAGLVPVQAGQEGLVGDILAASELLFF